MAPRKTIQHDIDRTARAIYKLSVHDLATVKHDEDYGIDFTSEFFEPYEISSAQISGLDFHVQCKGTSTLDTESDVVPYDLETDKLAYYLDRKRRPVFLVVVDVARSKGFWQFLQGYASDELAEKEWRKQDKVRIKIPRSQRLEDIALLRKAVELADARMRKLWPGEVKDLLAIEKARIEARDPRITVEVIASSAGLRFEIRGKENLTGKITISGKPDDVKRVAADAFDKGLPIKASDYGVHITAAGLPGHPAESLEIKEICSSRNLNMAIRVASVDLSGREYGAMEIDGTFRGGSMEGTLDCELPSKVFSVHAHIGPQSGGRPGAKISFRFDLTPWFNQRLLGLRDFDRLARVLKPLPDGAALIFELFVEGNRIAFEKLEPQSSDQLNALGVALYWLDQARAVAAKTNVDLMLPGPFIGEWINEIEFAYRFLQGESLPVKLSDTRMTTSSARAVASSFVDESKTSRGEALYQTDHFVRSILDQEVDLGPVEIHATGAVMEALDSKDDPNNRDRVLIDWRVEATDATVRKWQRGGT